MSSKCSAFTLYLGGDQVVCGKLKKKAITSILGDLDQSFSALPKFMDTLSSSNEMSIKGFPHLRPLIMVDTVELSSKHPGKLLVAAGFDTGNKHFSLINFEFVSIKRKIPVFCYWNGCIKDGPDGPFYQGSIPRVIRVESKTDLPTFLNDLRRVPSYHPSITNVEFYLEVKPLVSRPLPTNASLSKALSSRDANVDANLRDNSNGWTVDEESTEDRNCGDAAKGSHKKKQLILSSSWLDESELQIGMPFRDKEELDKAVKLYSVRRQREHHAYESSATFECKNGGCGWILKAAETKGTGFKITKYRGPHTCKPADVCSEFLAAELQGLIKAQPSLSVTELNKWVREEFGYTVSGDNMWEAKEKAITSILGDLDKSFSLLPNNLMTELVYKAGSSRYVSGFDCYLKKIEKMNPEAKEWLDQLPRQQWVLAYDDDGISELVKREDTYVKRVMTKLDEYMVASRAHDVLQLDQTGQQFQVTEGVKVGKKRFFGWVCACGVWQLCKYPCSHILAVCRKLNIDHLEYVNDYYSKEHSLEVYAADFSPLAGVSDWPEATNFPRLFPPGSRPDVRPMSQ
ncbi:hypothetical protein HID58_061844 [Brassica napus]|uniref:SWIM-type domain-containing protein n=1 Tax=Brassica napus TaxID=3708 RepID=A0ABQ7ZZX9_BRANA|nr:hypothetical protein HID58_061844 [Brassica napus]